MKKIVILGSTGSIGVQTLDVVDLSKNTDNEISVVGLAVYSNIDILFKQIIEYKPKYVCVVDEKKAYELKTLIEYNKVKVEILHGELGLLQLAKMEEYDVLVNSVVGIAGLYPTIEAIKNKKDIALANKETLVTGGKLIVDLAKENGVSILPLDSEHSAIFQCLQGNEHNKIKKIILTASGGSFRDKTLDELQYVTLEDALKHPNWNMGKKITIDSATLMNKGLEVIEAKWLFDLDLKQIDVAIHRQSIIHSMVEYMDNTVIAEMSHPDMRHPIQYALNYPNRLKNRCKPLNLIGHALTFEEVDEKRFPCLSYAYEALELGGNMCTIYNSANEEAVNLFLKRKIKYIDIQGLVHDSMNAFVGKYTKEYTLSGISYADSFARNFVKSKVR